MKKKLSELKENEYVYCASREEILRVYGKEHACGIPGAGGFPRDKHGEWFNIENLVCTGAVVLSPSTDFADFEAPKPKRPEERHRKLSNVRNVYDVVAAEKWNQLNDYTDYLEKENEELKSNIFVPFRVSPIRKYDNFQKKKAYDVIWQSGDVLLMCDDNNLLNFHDSGDFYQNKLH